MNRFAKLAAIRGLVRLPQPIARLFWMCLLGLWLWVFGIAGLKSLHLFGLVPSDWPS